MPLIQTEIKLLSISFYPDGEHLASVPVRCGIVFEGDSPSKTAKPNIAALRLKAERESATPSSLTSVSGLGEGQKLLISQSAGLFLFVSTWDHWPIHDLNMVI